MLWAIQLSQSTTQYRDLEIAEMYIGGLYMLAICVLHYIIKRSI